MVWCPFENRSRNDEAYIYPQSAAVSVELEYLSEVPGLHKLAVWLRTRSTPSPDPLWSPMSRPDVRQVLRFPVTTISERPYTQNCYSINDHRNIKFEVDSIWFGRFAPKTCPALSNKPANNQMNRILSIFYVQWKSYRQTCRLRMLRMLCRENCFVEFAKLLNDFCTMSKILKKISKPINDMYLYALVNFFAVHRRNL